MARRLAPLIAVGVVALFAVIAAVAGPVRVGDPIIPFDVRSAEPSPAPTFEADADEPEDEEVPANLFTVGVVLYTVVVGMAGIAMTVVLVVWAVRWLSSREPFANAAVIDRAGRLWNGRDSSYNHGKCAFLACFSDSAARISSQQAHGAERSGKWQRCRAEPVAIIAVLFGDPKYLDRVH